jgi:hypothetical protein
MATGGTSRGSKTAGAWFWQSSPSTAEIGNKWCYSSTLPLHVFMAYLYQNTFPTDLSLNEVPADLSVCKRHATDPAADGCNEPSECQGAGSWPAYLKGPHSERRQARTKTIGPVVHRAVAFVHGLLNNLNKKWWQWFHFLTIKMYFLWTNARISWIGGSFTRSYKANFDIHHTTHHTQNRVSLEKLTVAQLVKKFPASWDTKVHYHVHNSPWTEPILIPVHTLLPKIHFNIIIQSILISPKCSSDQGFHLQFFYTFIITPTCGTCPTT